MVLVVVVVTVVVLVIVVASADPLKQIRNKRCYYRATVVAALR